MNSDLFTSDYILHILLSYIGDITVMDFVSLSLVCWKYNAFFNHDRMWSQLWKSKYPLQQDAVVDFKFCFKQMHLYERSRKYTNEISDKEVGVCLVGSQGSGKTCLSTRFIHGFYDKNYDPASVEDRFIKTIRSAGNLVCINFLDTDSEMFEDSANLLRQRFQSAHHMLLCYDCRDEQSFEKAKYYLNIIKRYEKPITLVECKRDLDYKNYINQNIARKYAKEQGMYFVSTSAKDGINIDTTLQFVVQCSILIDEKLIKMLNNKKPLTKVQKCMIA
ncbi:hypothetical protein AKO1_008902 [Acrasis kona]|uniref:Uncharacterized protein n=1 Tax=Acrasis kona TaxID=1008807 RepID=A0AAW2ZEW0_9EUKA